jgi:hypothetical protein
MEVAVREWLRMQEPEFYCARMSKLVPRWNKCISVHYVAKQWCLFGISELHLMLWRGSATTRLVGLRVRIPPGAWMYVSCKCCVLSGTGLCVGLITCVEESYQV